MTAQRILTITDPRVVRPVLALVCAGIWAYVIVRVL